MTFIFFLLVLSALVIIHELGHFMAARIFGIKAEEFGFGFPPRIFGIVVKGGRHWKVIGAGDKKEYTNTIWSINWLPLGGFVRIKGEQEDHAHDQDSILMKPIWQRIIVVAAGVIMNWVLAIALFTTIFALGTTTYLEGLPSAARVADRQIVVTRVLEGSPADAGGIKTGDKILTINGTSPQDAEALTNGIGQAGTSQLALLIEHNGMQKSLAVTPTFLKEVGHAGIGIGLGDVGRVSLPLHLALKNGVLMTVTLTRDIVFALGGMVNDLFVRHQAPKEVSGPIGIAVIANQIAKQGITPFLQFAGILSVNLAVINLLPIPALDGGRIVFLLIEAVRRKPLKRSLEVGIYNIAFLLLIALVLLVTVRDLSRYGGEIVGGAKSFVDGL